MSGQRWAACVACVAGVAFAGCGGSGGGSSSGTTTTRTVNQTTRVEVLKQAGGTGGFDPTAVYREAAPGVVTVISIFSSSGLGSLLGEGDDQAGGLGSGFVISSSGEVLTNAHVVTDGQGSSLRHAKAVYVQFADSNQLQAHVVGIDPNSDVALLRIDPGGITLHPLGLGHSRSVVVGSPVVAIGSPFGEPQSLSVGVISAKDRSIRSLTGFRIEGALQTDAAVNHGNSGGPLVDAQGHVLGINSQIESTGGGGEGVGFAVPVDTVRRSVAELRRDGKVNYAYLGVETRPMYPQLAEKFNLPVHRGAYVQNVAKDSPAAKAGIRGGKRKVRFQVTDYQIGGDIITQVAGSRIRTSSDLGIALLPFSPGQKVRMTIWRDGKPRTVTVKLGARPDSP
jgi:S1-C subfamily serine protease